MLKGTLLTTIGILGVIWCLFLRPFGMLNATTLDWVIYYATCVVFFVMTAVGMKIRTKYIAANRDKK